MNPDVTLAMSGLATFIIGTAAFALLLPLLRKLQVVDVPNHRSSHTRPTVRGGGLGIVAALVGGLAIGAVLLPLAGGALQAVIWFGLTVGSFAALGWAEDTRGLRVRTRLGGQILISAAAAMGATAIGGLPLGLAVLAAAAGVFYVNAANFMDGVNGISSWHGTVVGAYFAAIGFLSDSVGLTLAGVVTAAAFLSFLPWNAPRARMFMGDVGSYALGAAAWALFVFAVTGGTPILVAAAPLAVYSADVVVTLLKRARRHAHLFDAHREHTYQLVQQISGSHQASMSHATVATVASSAMGLWALSDPSVTLAAIGGIVAVCSVYFISPPVVANLREVNASNELVTDRGRR